MIEFTTVAVRLTLALAFGALIGVEREWRQKHAGLKTMKVDLWHLGIEDD